jgi:hypothetical protein
MSPQIINSDLGLYRYFNIASSLFRNSLISPEGALYTSVKTAGNPAEVQSKASAPQDGSVEHHYYGSLLAVYS